MKKEMIEFINENNLNPFNKGKTKISVKQENIFKTKDARQVFSRTIDKISGNFVFPETENLWHVFQFSSDVRNAHNDCISELQKLIVSDSHQEPQFLRHPENPANKRKGFLDITEIIRRQEFFKTIKKNNNVFLKELTFPKKWWKPKYGILAVTEDEKTFTELQKLNVPCQFLNSQYDLEGLESYDIVQVIDCDNFSSILEKLTQSVFLDSLNEVYLERYLEILSGWQKNLEILQKNETNEEIIKIVSELAPLLKMLDNNQTEKISREQAETGLEEINKEIEIEISKMNISGTSLMAMLSKGELPDEFLRIVESAIKKTKLPEEIFKNSIPAVIDEDELERLIKKQNASEHTEIAENVKRKSSELRKIPEDIRELENLLVYFDFCSGISQVIKENHVFPELSSEFFFSEAENIFLDDAQPISFSLNEKEKCSILTGANSGGKTTLLEHIIQLITFFQLGLPVKGRVKIPVFSEIYYFAKNKGSASKGAFETLLTQMATIKPGNKTLILADEIESVTEPGVAGKIISATADFFIQRGCFLVVSTHLGQEIQKNPPSCSRIDGIEAKGLDENFELIVDHNPVLGKIASSTPELIIEKMASLNKEEYFQFLRDRIKGK